MSNMGKSVVINLLTTSMLFVGIAFASDGVFLLHDINLNGHQYLKKMAVLDKALTSEIGLQVSSVKSNTQIPSRVYEYAEALQKHKNQSEKKSIEYLYHLGNEAADKLRFELENLTEEEFIAVKNKMEGFSIGRIEVISVVPETGYFISLANGRGLNADVAFFELYDQTIINGWPVYIKRRTDFSGCTKYGNGQLVGLYGKWLEFQRGFPDVYVDDVSEVFGHIKRELTSSPEAKSCGSSTDVIHELELFIRTFPKSELSSKIQSRIDDIQKRFK